MNEASFRERVLPALLSGTRREALPDLGIMPAGDPRWPVHALSLAGQALRFEKPAAPEHFTTERWPLDGRCLVAAKLRSRIVRLLSSKQCSEASEMALAWAFARHKLRPHPFDFPKLGDFVHRYAGSLGVTAQHWAHREDPAERRNDYFDAEEINAETWTQAPRSGRVHFLEELRARNPEAARELMASVWAQEDPDTRFRFASTLQTGLTEEDRTFLKDIERDRAPRVRMLVQRLLARLPGESAENPALRACLSRIQKTRKGKISRRTVVELELPANVKEQAANRWIQEQFDGVSLDELAAALEIAPEELVVAAEDDSNLLFALALMASREKRFALLASITALAPDVWGRMSAVNEEEPSFANAGGRSRWVTALVHPAQWNPDLPIPAWSWVLRRMEGPLPLELMRELLRSQWWKEQLAQDPPPRSEWVQVFCALCPPALRRNLSEAMEPLVAESKDEGSLLLEILDALENER